MARNANFFMVDQAPDLSFPHSDYLVNFIMFILSYLLKKGNGAVFAEWNVNTNLGEWFYTDGISLASSEKIKIFSMDDKHAFRSILCRMGNTFTGNVYAGADVVFATCDTTQEKMRLMVALCNFADTGNFWIWLKIIPPAPVSNANQEDISEENPPIM